MTVVTIIGQVTGVAPMHEIIPVAVAGQVIGTATPRPFVMLAGMLSHLFYRRNVRHQPLLRDCPSSTLPQTFYRFVRTAVVKRRTDTQLPLGIIP
jgi:hypothetical protein